VVVCGFHWRANLGGVGGWPSAPLKVGHLQVLLAAKRCRSHQAVTVKAIGGILEKGQLR